jgi:hypothetical protein
VDGWGEIALAPYQAMWLEHRPAEPGR